jgi:hypothetical protein
MSDGPYKTLRMSAPWKRVAKVAENAAHSSAEVVEALRPALLQDWGTVRPDFSDEIRSALGDSERGNLLPTVALVETQRLRSAASNPMEALLAEQACDMARDGQVGRQAFEAAVKVSLEERAIRRAWQIEEHYLRERSPDAGRLRAQLGASIASAEIGQLAVGIASGASARSLAPKTDRSGLDEGVPL